MEINPIGDLGYELVINVNVGTCGWMKKKGGGGCADLYECFSTK